MTILFQNVFLVLLLWYYMKDRPSNLGITMIIAGFIATAGACAMLPSDYMVLLPLSNLPLIFLAKVPQARQTHRQRERERKGITSHHPHGLVGLSAYPWGRNEHKYSRI